MAEIKVKYGQNIYDLAIQSGYTIDNVYKLIRENSFIDSIDFDFEANPNKTVEYDSTFRIVNPPQLTKKNTSAPANQVTGVIKENQTWYDLVLQSGYPLEKVYKYLIDNNITNIDAAPVASASFTFEISEMSDVGFYKKLRNNSLTITTDSI
jgi:hypothetical protein